MPCNPTHSPYFYIRKRRRRRKKKEKVFKQSSFFCTLGYFILGMLDFKLTFTILVFLHISLIFQQDLYSGKKRQFRKCFKYQSNKPIKCDVLTRHYILIGHEIDVNHIKLINSINTQIFRRSISKAGSCILCMNDTSGSLSGMSGTSDNLVILSLNVFVTEAFRISFDQSKIESGSMYVISLYMHSLINSSSLFGCFHSYFCFIGCQFVTKSGNVKDVAYVHNWGVFCLH